ncbi:hypothetical protein Ciccas_005792 [Cichlidogyrus casuarinus]|uniref:Lethal giant larvae homologue 2 domain-containing protein n=1 Tax=Cichlidogyrus casuarinus TaxID=1844966 RepID=A0ABD2Q7M7_9PLAT
MSSKSKKIFKVLDGLRALHLNPNHSSNSAKSSEIDEFLRAEDFNIFKMASHGFPYEPKCIAFDPIQKLLAIGTINGVVKIYGRPGVDVVLNHPTTASVFAIFFLINEGEIVTLCQDDVAHLWSIKQKPPEIIHSLQFKRERLTSGHLAMGSNWLYLGTEKGNVHFVQIKKFVTSGYVINWNKAIDLNQSTHPGAVVQLAENPQDSNKLLIGYNTGFLVLWDLKSRVGETRFRFHEPLYGVSWHFEGKNFLTSHANGLLVTWNCKQSKQLSVQCPHGYEFVPEDKGSYEAIRKVEWIGAKSGEAFVIFSGGGVISSTGPESTDGETSYANLPPPSVTVMRGKRLAVMQMDYPLTDFVSLCDFPYTFGHNRFASHPPTGVFLLLHYSHSCFTSLPDNMDPYAVAVLLKSDLVVIDLISPSFPSFENPYPMDVHSSPVTAINYLADCPNDLMLQLYSLDKHQARLAALAATAPPNGEIANEAVSDAFSSREWPINGGNPVSPKGSLSELIITGHGDGSVRFWDASAMNFHAVYKFRTQKLFEPYRLGSQSSTSADSSILSGINSNFSPAIFEMEEDPIGIRLMQFCPDSRRLLLASGAHLCLLKFSNKEVSSEISVGFPFYPLSSFSSSMHEICIAFLLLIVFIICQDMKVFVALRSGVRKWPAGLQPELVCRMGVASLSFELSSFPGAQDTGCILPPPHITACAYCSAGGLLAFGNDSGLAVIDSFNRTILLSVATSELYG